MRASTTIRFRQLCRFALPLVLFLSVSCNAATYPARHEAPSLVVHGVLLAGTNRQEIVVEYTRPLSDGLYRGITPASGARVTVAGDETYRFSEDPARPGIYRASFIPRSGQRYTLTIQGPADEVVTSETVVPGIPRLIAPSRDTTIARSGNVTLRWNSTPIAAGYTTLASEPNDSSTIFGVIQTDTTETVELGLFAYSGGDTLRVRVAALDSNYVRYNPDGLRPGDRYQLRSTVSGGWGVFGSVAISEPARTVTLNR